MPDQFTSVATADPGSIKSGGTTKITVGYRSESKSTMTISCSPGFAVSPKEKELDAAPGGTEAKVSVTIERKKPSLKQCLVTLTAFDDTDSRDCSVMVTP